MNMPARQELAPTTRAEMIPPPANLMDALIRAASDPNVDVDKLERLGALVERLNAQQAEGSYHDAMNAAQEAMRPIAADANNPQTHSKYASYAALDRALRPTYTRHGFSLSFDTDESPKAEHIRVLCRVARAGHKEIHHIDMPADGKGAKGGDVMTKTHAAGAAVTYGRRYLLGMIFNIAVGDPGKMDDDGNSNGGRDMSEVAQRAKADINTCETAAELALWKKNKAGGVEGMITTEEWNEVVRLWNRRATALKGGANA